LHDFIKELKSFITLNSSRLDFAFMRFQDIDTVYDKDVNAYIDAHSPIDDSYRQIASQMISVNLALFGNHTHLGECTFSYFLSNKSANTKSLYFVLEPIFSCYSLDKKYIKHLEALSKELTSSTGNLMQIFIPMDKVDQLVYLSEPYGKPYKKCIYPSVYDTKKQRHISIRPILDLYRNQPKTIKDLDALQARMLFFPPLFDTDSDIKIFRYNTIPADTMQRYETKLKKIVAEVMEQYISDMPQQRSEPLFRLHRYLQSPS